MGKTRVKSLPIEYEVGTKYSIREKVRSTKHGEFVTSPNPRLSA